MFGEAGFNEVDNLIFSELVYVDFGGIVPKQGEGGSILLKDASAAFFMRHTDEEIQAKVSYSSGFFNAGNGKDKTL